MFVVARARLESVNVTGYSQAGVVSTRRVVSASRPASGSTETGTDRAGPDRRPVTPWPGQCALCVQMAGLGERRRSKARLSVALGDALGDESRPVKSIARTLFEPSRGTSQKECTRDWTRSVAGRAARWSRWIMVMSG